MKRVTLFLLVVLTTAPLPALAQVRPPDLTELSIEDLMSVEITSASRKEQRAADVAAAVFVITHEHIRRSGMTSIPDLLRLAPGVEVAQINSNKWAVTVRGFNGLYANKLLVLIDGRSVYSRIFSGVLWDAEDLMIDDIDRIEVIRGPGAAMWGANAVNGVINIVTRVATDTQGVLVRVNGGRSGEQAAIRYGATAGAMSYRLYSQWTGRDESLIAPGTQARDASHSITTGFRADWTTLPGALLLEGAFIAGRTRALWPNLNPQTAALKPLADDPTEAKGGHLLGRWTQKRAGGGSWQIQSFMEIAGRQEPIGNYQRRTVDVDTQYRAAFGARHDLVAGTGYRFSRERFDGQVGYSLTPPGDSSSRVTAFVQDEIALLGDRVAVTFGTQAQYDSNVGAGLQPSARVMWKVRPDQRLWAAASRALRTPSLYEQGIRVDRPPTPTPAGIPLFVVALGNPSAKTEQFVDAEAGYRFDIGATASVDLTGFVGRYDDLRTQEVSAPTLRFAPSPQLVVTSTFGNQLQATTRGLEVAFNWRLGPDWDIGASYTAFRVIPTLAAASQDPRSAMEDGDVPRAQWQVHSSYSPGSRATINVAFFHVGRLERIAVAPYTRADINADWLINRRLSVRAIGQNLFDAAHAEFGGPQTFLLATQVPRSASVQLVWRSQ